MERDLKGRGGKEKWVRDVSEFGVNGGKVYLCGVIDVLKKEVIC